MAKSAPTTDRLPQDKKSKNQHRFTFRTLAGDIIDVPAPGFVPIPVLLSLRKLQDVEGDDVLDHIHLIYDIADTDDGRKGLTRLGTVELKRFFKLWGKRGDQGKA